jgi:hypothetical protein
MKKLFIIISILVLVGCSRRHQLFTPLSENINYYYYNNSDSKIELYTNNITISDTSLYIFKEINQFKNFNQIELQTENHILNSIKLN